MLRFSSIRTPFAKLTEDIECLNQRIPKGEIVKIDRFDPETGYHVCYRQVNDFLFVATDDQLEAVKTKRFAVDIHFDLAHCIEVNARTAKEAEHIILEKVCNGEITANSSGFEQTDDYEVRCSGKENKDGEIEYF